MTHDSHRTQAPVALFLIGNLGGGGVVRVLLNLVNHPRRVRPAVVVRIAEGALMPELAPDVPLFELATGAHTPVPASVRSGHSVAARARPPRGLTLRSLSSFWSECRALQRVVRETGATTVVTFIMRGHLLALLTRRLFAPRLRVVVSMHEYVSETERLHFPNPVERRIMRIVMRFLIGRADVVTVPAAPLRDDLVRLGVPGKVVVRRNPVDLEVIRARAREPVELPELPPPGTHLIVGVGRLVDWKSYHVLVEAMSMIPPSIPCHCLILGEGPERARLETLATQLAVTDRVRLPGFCDNPWKYLARADCFAHPSRTEAQGLVFVEAMALGVPVVASGDSRGIRASLDDGRLGILVPHGDPAALADAIVRLLGDSARRAELARLGQEASAEFDIRNAVDQFEDVMIRDAAAAVS